VDWPFRHCDSGVLVRGRIKLIFGNKIKIGSSTSAYDLDISGGGPSYRGWIYEGSGGF
jgi:hypothetical protein